VGLVAYLIMGWALTFLAFHWLDAARIGLAVYGIFDFTSTYMWHAWSIKVRILYRYHAAVLAILSKLTICTLQHVVGQVILYPLFTL